SAEFVHVAEIDGELNSSERSVLEKLLTYGPSRAVAPVTGLVQVVAPRPGTISPWSSKATDIAHICGLAKVRRIERVVAYTIDLAEICSPARERRDVRPLVRPCAPAQGYAKILAAKLHDRMTQVVFPDLASCEIL